MKKYFLLMLFGLCYLHPIPAGAIHKVLPTQQTKEEIKEAAEKSKEAWQNKSHKEKKAERKQMRKELKTAITAAKKDGADDDQLLLIIIAILLPPLAMAIYDGITDRFWISLLLTLLFYLPGLIYTLVIILGEK
ncbi:MAG: YqaE/Pmp3 family membrane protein [Saprospiraceae bacterium]